MDQDRSSPLALDSILKAVQVLSVVIGVVVSIFTVASAAKKDAEARQAEAVRRTLELEKFSYQQKLDSLSRARQAAMPFLKLRMARYEEVVKVAGILADREHHTEEQHKHAVRRFWELYWAELSMVESDAVEYRMVDLKKALFPQHVKTSVQDAVLHLAQEIRKSTADSWGIKTLDTPLEADAQ